MEASHNHSYPQKTRKYRKPYQLYTYSFNKLHLQNSRKDDQSKSNMVPWIQQPPFKPTNKFQSQKKYHTANIPNRNFNQGSIHQKIIFGCSPFWPWKSLRYKLAIWHTQRPQRSLPTKQTPHLHKTLPKSLDLPNKNKKYTLRSKTTRNRCTSG